MSFAPKQQPVFQPSAPSNSATFARSPGIIDAEIVPLSKNPGVATINISPKPVGSSAIDLYKSPTSNLPKLPTPSTPTNVGRTGGRIAGGFFPKVVPPGVGGAVARRILPGVGWLLFAYDAYQFACQTGVLGSRICPNEGAGLPISINPNFKGGQCNSHYLFLMPGQPQYGGYMFSGGTLIGIDGPIKSMTFLYTHRSYDDYPLHHWEICNNAGFCRIWYGASKNGTPSPIPVRVDNNGNSIADTCGDPGSQPGGRSQAPVITNITNITNNTNNYNIKIFSPEFIIPPRPTPTRPPIIITPPDPFPIPFDKPEIDSKPRINSDPLPNLNPRPNPEPNSPQPQPESPTPTPTPTPTPEPPASPTSPIPPPRERDFDFEDCDPCQTWIMRGIHEILEKLYRVNAEILEIQQTQAEHGLILDNVQSLIDIELEGSHILTSCDDVETVYSYKAKALTGINKHLEQLEFQHDQILRDICAIEAETQIAAPDWWRLRLAVNPPQICVVFRRQGYRDYYNLTIPHPINTNEPSVSPLPAYTKGNWQGMIVCNDNSKFIVNAVSPEEANRVCNIAIGLISPGALGNAPRVYISERKGAEAVSVDRMLPRAVMYYSTGQRNMNPDWRKSFHANDPIEQTS